MHKFKTKGFTLAEVLITLGIIGVIAAFTIPTLMQRIGNIALEKAFVKSYSMLSQAYSLSTVNSGDVVSSFGGSQANFFNSFKDTLKVVKHCPINSDDSCWPAYKDLSTAHATGAYSADWDTYDTAILSDGATVLFRLDDADCMNSYGTDAYSKGCGFIIVNVNGAQGPNIIGKDVFGFYVTQSGVKPYGATEDSNWGDYCSSASASNGYAGMGCAAKVLKEGAINY